MKNVPLDKIRTLAVTKVASLFVLVVLAVAFFAFPLVAFGDGGTGGTGWNISQNITVNSVQQPSITVTLFAAYKIQTDDVSPSDTGHFWPDPKTDFLNKAPIGVNITTHVKASVDCPVGAIVQVDPPPGTKLPTSDHGVPLTSHLNALCTGLNPTTGKNTVLVIINGQLTNAVLVDSPGSSTN